MWTDATTILIAIASIGFASAAIGQAPLPEDVARFIERRDACDHFRGEEAYDAKRREFLEQQTIKLCVGSDEQLAGLKKKYAGNKVVMTKLDDYEPEIEAPSQK
jgi:hypothetical protein